MRHWLKVQKDLGSIPISEGDIYGDTPMHVERYLFRSLEKVVSGIGPAALIAQLGGARVNEGEVGQWRLSTLPSQSMLIPPNCATHWHYSGTVDFVVFYFPDQPSGITEQLRALASTSEDPLLFNDQLVSAAALQLVNELALGTAANSDYVARLAHVMLEQGYRALTTTPAGCFDPHHVHYSRLQEVLSYIHGNLSQSLTAESLSIRAEISCAHFRRIFLEAMGVPLHQYVLNTRMNQARKLLTQTAIPISRIAEDCGFSSQSHLTACFRKLHAATPAEFRGRNTF